MRGGVELIIGAIRTGTHVSMLKSIVVLKYIKLFTVEMSKVFFCSNEYILYVLLLFS